MKIRHYLFLGSIISSSVCIANKPLPHKALLKAVEQYDFSKAKKIVQSYPDIMDDDPTYYYWTTRLNAAFARKFTVVCPLSRDYQYLKELVHYGFDLDGYDQYGVSLLSNVIKYNHGDKYLHLLQGGADPNRQDVHGKSPIVYAAELCDDEKIEKLLMYGAAVNKSTYSHLPFYHPKRALLFQLFVHQECYVCNKHDYDLYNISCVNRHLEHFICMRCYYNQKKCPICSRTLGRFGF